MTDAAVAALSALGGALIGSLGGGLAAIIGYMQANRVRQSEDRRHTWQIGLELGLKEWEAQFEQAKKHGGQMWPPQLYAYFSARFLQLAEDNRLTPDTYSELDTEIGLLGDAVKRVQGIPLPPEKPATKHP